MLSQISVNPTGNSPRSRCVSDPEPSQHGAVLLWLLLLPPLHEESRPGRGHAGLRSSHTRPRTPQWFALCSFCICCCVVFIRCVVWQVIISWTATSRLHWPSVKTTSLPRSCGPRASEWSTSRPRSERLSSPAVFGSSAAAGAEDKTAWQAKDDDKKTR